MISKIMDSSQDVVLKYLLNMILIFYFSIAPVQAQHSGDACQRKCCVDWRSDRTSCIRTGVSCDRAVATGDGASTVVCAAFGRIGVGVACTLAAERGRNAAEKYCNEQYGLPNGVCLQRARGDNLHCVNRCVRGNNQR